MAWKLVYNPDVPGDLLSKDGTTLVGYDDTVHPEGPPPECCCPGGNCCDEVDLPDELDVSIVGSGECVCLNANITAPRLTTAHPGHIWTYEGISGAVCPGGTTWSVLLFCKDGVTYASYGQCHTDPTHQGPSPVTMHSCDPFHASVTIELMNRDPDVFGCCDGSITIEFTEA